jgi:hypothetical protein
MYVIWELWTYLQWRLPDCRESLEALLQWGYRPTGRGGEETEAAVVEAAPASLLASLKSSCENNDRIIFKQISHALNSFLSVLMENSKYLSLSDCEWMAEAEFRKTLDGPKHYS